MLNVFKLILPIIVPSWRFFDVIAPSPRIQYALLNRDNVIVTNWCEFRPRPRHMSLFQILMQLLWNANWNESLYMVSCAEKILENSPYQEKSEIAIIERIRQSIIGDKTDLNLEPAVSLQFILILLEKKNNEISESIYFQSRIIPLDISETKQ